MRPHIIKETNRWPFDYLLMNTFQHAKFEVGLYLAISKITWTLRGLVLNAPQLSELEWVFCEAPITLEELAKAWISMENNKSPGFYGLSTNFYKHFWPLLVEKLVIVYNYAFQSGCLLVSQQRGVISLAFKKGDQSLLKNWGPITLLATDYKILTKALATRLHLCASICDSFWSDGLSARKNY